MLDKVENKIAVDNTDLLLAGWRSQAFWGTTVWLSETLISKRLLLRHFYILSSLTDREALIVADVDVEQMSTTRLTEQIQRQFADEYEGGREVGARMAEKDKKLLAEEGYIYLEKSTSEKADFGWRITSKGLDMMNEIADGLGDLAITQAKKLQELLPEKGTIMTENDGFYDRMARFFSKAKMTMFIPIFAFILLLSATNEGKASGPRDFGDGTLTLPMMTF